MEVGHLELLWGLGHSIAACWVPALPHLPEQTPHLLFQPKGGCSMRTKRAELMPCHNLKQNSEKGENPFSANSKVPAAFFWVWYAFIYIYLFQYTILINSSIEVRPL